MWVRIDEIAFAAERADEVIGRVRNTAVSMHDGEGFRGFRLLVDKTGGRALDVSYWDNRSGAAACHGVPTTDVTEAARTTVIRSNIYELSIDAV